MLDGNEVSGFLITLLALFPGAWTTDLEGPPEFVGVGWNSRSLSWGMSCLPASEGLRRRPQGRKSDVG